MRPGEPKIKHPRISVRLVSFFVMLVSFPVRFASFLVSLASFPVRLAFLAFFLVRLVRLASFFEACLASLFRPQNRVPVFQRLMTRFQLSNGRMVKKSWRRCGISNSRLGTVLGAAGGGEGGAGGGAGGGGGVGAADRRPQRSFSPARCNSKAYCQTTRLPSQQDQQR